MSTERRWSIDKQIRSEAEAARKTLEELLDRLAADGWTEDQTFGIHLAVEEALMNAIKHGNKRDPQKLVSVSYDLAGKDLRVVIEDEGAGFNLADVPDPTLDENLELPSGRGLMLMNTFMTTVEYNDRGNRVTMYKDLTQADPIDD